MPVIGGMSVCIDNIVITESLPAPTFTSITPNSGTTLGGTPVVIIGQDFTSGASLGVTIDGVAATGVAFVSSTEIDAITPAGTAGLCDVIVTSGDGQTVTGTGAYTYITPITVTEDSSPYFEFSRSRSGFGTNTLIGGMQAWGPVSPPSSQASASTSLWEQDVNGDLMPIASPVTRGLFAVDENGDIMPATVQLSDTYFQLDDNGDIEPK